MQRARPFAETIPRGLLAEYLRIVGIDEYGEGKRAFGGGGRLVVVRAGPLRARRLEADPDGVARAERGRHRAQCQLGPGGHPCRRHGLVERQTCGVKT